MRQKNKYVQIGLMIFFVLAGAILFYFLIAYLPGIFGFFGGIIKILAPVLIGGAIAYMLNPIVVALNGKMLELFDRTRLSIKTRKKIASSISISVAMIFFLAIIVAIFWVVIPQVTDSISNLVSRLDEYGIALGTYICTWLEGIPNIDENLPTEIMGYFEGVTAMLTDWLRNTVLGSLDGVMDTVKDISVGALNAVINTILGLCVAVYLLVSKHRFIGQIKKLMYSIFKKETVNVILAVSRQMDSVFGGFISGKLLDSLIIGILCAIGCLIMRMPYTALISVVVGVTNIVPVFGPWAGAIPSILLILALDPKKALIFAIFVLALQQFDGNILGPNILGDSTGLNAFWVVVAITLGGGLFGVIGMVLGVPSFAVIYFLIKTLVEFRLKEMNMPVQTISYTKLKRIDPETLNAEFINTGISKRERRKQNIFAEDVSREIAIAANLARKNRQMKELGLSKAKSPVAGEVYEKGEAVTVNERTDKENME